jgi:hypothetical protein
MLIRPFEPSDRAGVWVILEPVFRTGDTYAYPTGITETEARAAWVDKPLATFLAQDDEGPVGTYYLVAIQPGRGSHVKTADTRLARRHEGKVSRRQLRALPGRSRPARLPGDAAQLRGIDERGCRAAVHQARFRHRWDAARRLHHPTLGYVDALVMFKTLRGATIT